MPDPLSSSTARPKFSEASCGYGDDSSSLTCHDPAPALPALLAPVVNSCAAPVPSAEPPVSNAASALVQKFSKSDYAPLLAASATASVQPPSIASPSGPPAFTVGHDQLEFQTGLPQLVDRGTRGNLQVTAKGDVLNVNAHAGASNEDGSYGANVGASANLLNGEVTVDYKGWSFSLGLGLSLGGSIASGEGRDLDGDGVSERCFKMSLGPLTLGECDEL
jgi:hypothetical protein